MIFGRGVGVHEEFLEGDLRRRGLGGCEYQLQAVNDPVDNGMLREEGDDAHVDVALPLTVSDMESTYISIKVVPTGADSNQRIAEKIQLFTNDDWERGLAVKEIE